MYCAACGNPFATCPCPDLEQRLEALARESGGYAWKRCRLFGRHHARCRCPEPAWEVFGPGDQVIPLGEDGIERLYEVLGGEGGGA